jgi:cytidyltransferase-like protein
LIIIDKYTEFNNLSKVVAKEKSCGRRVVHCHGTFDLIHPGHIVHFEEAKQLGDVLVITITGEEYVNKGPGRPHFNDELRIRTLQSLQCVDYISVVPFPAAVEAIKAVRGDVYCKGKEYENPKVDSTGNIHDDIKAVEEVGGEIAYVGSVVFSSSKLLNNHFEHRSENTRNLIKKVTADFNINSITRIIESFSSLKVLVLGDLIIDKYSTVAVQGLTSKNRILSSRFIEENSQPGGALAIFRHIREFTPNVKFFSLSGSESWLENFLCNYLSKNENLVHTESCFTTIIKHRYVEPLATGKEISKLFSINHINSDQPSSSIQSKISSKLKGIIKDFDLVLVADFGHGLMSDKIRNLVQEESTFMALNCQTNSNNYGFNVINRKYDRADSFSLDQTEMSLACEKKKFNASSELKRLVQKFSAKYGWLTRGGSETIGISIDEQPCICDSLEKIVTDTVGAGDAFCSIASLAAVKNLPLELSTLMGQISGAIGVRIVGNSEPVRKIKFLKSLEAILKS